MSSEAGRPATARARELGGELRQIREQAGITRVDLAGMLGWSPSKITRMEKGTRGTAEVDVAMYLARCRAPANELERLLALAATNDDAYRVQSHRERLPDELKSITVHETTASAISSYALLQVPGLLQTEDYAQALFRWARLVPEHIIDSRVHARLTRQSMLRRHQPPRQAFFIHEHALRSVAGSPRVMHEQLLHILFTCSLSHCLVRVVPHDAGPWGALGGSFRLLRYTEHAPMAHVEQLTGTLMLEDHDDVALYGTVLRRLDQIALTETQSRAWLAHRASEQERAAVGG